MAESQDEEPGDALSNEKQLLSSQLIVSLKEMRNISNPLEPAIRWRIEKI